MSEEIHVGIGWSIETLRIHLESLVGKEHDLAVGNDRRYGERFDAEQQAIKDALAAADRAGEKAERAASLQISALSEKVDQLREAVTLTGGRSQGTNQTWAAIGVAVLVVVSVVGLIITIVTR